MRPPYSTRLSLTKGREVNNNNEQREGPSHAIGHNPLSDPQHAASVGSSRAPNYFPDLVVRDVPWKGPCCHGRVLDYCPWRDAFV